MLLLSCERPYSDFAIKAPGGLVHPELLCRSRSPGASHLFPMRTKKKGEKGSKVNGVDDTAQRKKAYTTRAKREKK